MKLGLVVPRYGVDVVGGIEHWLRLLCEHLVALKQWDVEVFTTCAVSAATWADDLPPGDSELDGVTVHRRRSVSGRDPRSGPMPSPIDSSTWWARSAPTFSTTRPAPIAIWWR
jgi:hypothetical protein